MKQIAWIILGSLAFVESAHSAGFDCTKASTKIEKLICADSELSKLDSILMDVYRLTIDKNIEKANAIQDQRLWLKNERNTCENIDCLWDFYQARITKLSANITQADSQLRYDGLYKNFVSSPAFDSRGNADDSENWDYLRFYSDGTVYLTATAARPQDIQKWFNSKNPNVTKGKYIIKGISISCTFQGIKLDQSSDEIQSPSKYMGIYKGERIYFFLSNKIEHSHGIETYDFVGFGDDKPANIDVK